MGAVLDRQASFYLRWIEAPVIFSYPICPEKILEITSAAEAVATGETLTVRNVSKNLDFVCKVQLAPRQRKILTAGGLLNYTRRG